MQNILLSDMGKPMSIIISFFQTVGGEGKSALARGAAYSRAFSKAFKSIALVELDRQGDSTEWLKRRGDRVKKDKVQFLALPETKPDDLKKSLLKVIKESEIVILDCPGEGKVDFASELALNLSHLVLIPMRVSAKTRRLFVRNQWPTINDILSSDPSRTNSFYIVPTFIHPQTRPETVIQYFEGIMPPQISILESVFSFRNIYENFEEEGMTLLEYARSVKGNKRMFNQAGRALLDIEKISNDIINLIS